MQNISTLLFTDVEGSTRLWELHPEAMSKALRYHDLIINQTIEAFQGKIFKSLGDGFCAVFDSAPKALQAALNIQRLLFQIAQRPDDPMLYLAVRVGLHSGVVEERANDYFGATVNRVSRLMNAAHGGQILLSSATKDLLPHNASLRDLGTHQLRDINEPIHIFQATSADFPVNVSVIRTLSSRPNNLPSQLTSFIGREQNVTEICQKLRQPNVRLLTLIGTGGIGKTRLSIQVGASLLDEYEEGVFFISLAPVHNRDAILKLVAQVLEIQEDEPANLLRAITAQLQQRQTLLIFDNYEHVLDEASLVNELLTAAPRLKILTTSRESLFVYGEHTYSVPPLNLPEMTQSAADLVQSPAVTLFMNRVQAIQPEFVLNDETAPDVVNICRQLEGIPLALELAAARVRDLTLKAIVEGLSRRLALLDRGPRDLPKRQQTMRGAVEWSYQLLSSEEQHIFARLAIFEGQFYEAAALNVTGVTSLSNLRNKHLLQPSGDQRFSMLAVLREYAFEQLVAFDEVQAISEKHAIYYCEWLEVAQEHLNGRDQIEWFGRVEVEQYNLQRALEWFVRQEHIEDAGRMVAILWRYWATQSQLSEGDSWLRQVLSQSDKLSPLLRARVLQGTGRLALLRNDLDHAIEYQQASVQLYQQVGNIPGQAAVSLSLGETESVQGNDEQAQHYFAASLKLFRELSDQAGIGRCLNNMGKIATRHGDFATAEPLLRESLALARAHGSSEGIALASYDLAGVLRAEKKFQDAESCYRESLGLYQELNFPAGIAVMTCGVGFAIQGQGDPQSAFKYFMDALKVLQPLEELSAIAESLVGVASVLLDLNHYALSGKTLSAAEVMITSAGHHLDYADQRQYDRVCASSDRDPAAWQKSWEAGQSIPLPQLMKEILKLGL